MRTSPPDRTSARLLRVAALVSLTAVPATAAHAYEGGTYAVEAESGNSSMTAVFDAPLGERITAVSTAVGCDLAVGADGASVTGACSLPLRSITVDGNETKTEHFQQWATNKKVDAAQCTFDMKVAAVRLERPLADKARVPFTADVTFTTCGRSRDGGAVERVTGDVVLLPAGTYGKAETLRIRARIAGFDREAYGVSPKQTLGWLARVQMLADVVAAKGDIELNLFAKRR